MRSKSTTIRGTGWIIHLNWKKNDYITNIKNDVWKFKKLFSSQFYFFLKL